MGTRSRIILLAVVLLISGFSGLMVARAVAPTDEAGGTLVKRVRNGVTETGTLETVTTNGLVKRVIRWKTRSGQLVTQTVEGPTRVVRLNGTSILVPGPSYTSTVFGTTTLPGGTVIVTGPGATTVQTLPGETVTQTLPVETVTQTLPVETVTQTLPVETVTETVRDTVTVHDTVTEVQTVTETVTTAGG